MGPCLERSGPQAGAQAAPTQLRHPEDLGLAASELGVRPQLGRGEGQAELRPQMWGIRAAFFPARLSPQRPARLLKASAAPCCSLRAALQLPPQRLGAEESSAGPWGWVPSSPQCPPNASQLPTTSCGVTSSPPPLSHSH